MSDEAEAIELSDFAVTPRYPDAVELEERDMRQALIHARKVVLTAAHYFSSMEKTVDGSEE
ncbi:MAG: HEPN domain-containing protein [Oscillospiraceae bacterium]|jgi:hypothetical protein|nr:HEPN domain-containing protein [Oscillospiraceae bacterium]